MLKRWDYQTELRFESTVQVDRRTIVTECGLGHDVRVGLLTTWWASSTNLRRTGNLVELNESIDYVLSFDVPAGVTGGSLTLQRQLVIIDAGSTDNPLAARTPGSVLWREPRENRATVYLEGEAARFPTEVIDFQSGRVADSEAAWWLDRDLSDLEATPLNGLRLYLNEHHEVMKQVLAGATDPVATLTAEFLKWDVTRSLMNAALDTDEFIEGWGGFRPGSLGEVLELLIRKYWPGEDAQSLTALRNQDPGVFDARLQGRMRLLSEMS
jgi:hypothetical protein